MTELVCKLAKVFTKVNISLLNQLRSISSRQIFPCCALSLCSLLHSEENGLRVPQNFLRMKKNDEFVIWFVSNWLENNYWELIECTELVTCGRFTPFALDIGSGNDNSEINITAIVVYAKGNAKEMYGNMMELDTAPRFNDNTRLWRIDTYIWISFSRFNGHKFIVANANSKETANSFNYYSDDTVKKHESVCWIKEVPFNWF